MEEHMHLKVKIQDLAYQIQNQSTYEFYNHNNQNIEQKNLGTLPPPDIHLFQIY